MRPATVFRDSMQSERCWSFAERWPWPDCIDAQFRCPNRPSSSTSLPKNRGGGRRQLAPDAEGAGIRPDAPLLRSDRERRRSYELSAADRETRLTEETTLTDPAIATSRPAVPGPVEGTRLTEAYARLVARDAYFRAWPLVNIYNRRMAFKQAPEVGLMNGVLPFAPLNRMSMLHDYIEPSGRWVACPNQDVVYGAGIAALDETAVVVQVPDFGTRFWVYQIVDLRTDSFADIGIMYGTKPGSICSSGRTGRGTYPTASRRSSRPRPAPRSSCRIPGSCTRSNDLPGRI